MLVMFHNNQDFFLCLVPENHFLIKEKFMSGKLMINQGKSSSIFWDMFISLGSETKTRFCCCFYYSSANPSEKFWMMSEWIRRRNNGKEQLEYDTPIGFVLHCQKRIWKSINMFRSWIISMKDSFRFKIENKIQQRSLPNWRKVWKLSRNSRTWGSRGQFLRFSELSKRSLSRTPQML